MKVKYDFSELIKFLEDVRDSKEATFMKVTQSIAKVLYQHLVEQTPVKTGNLREMWSASDNLKFTVNQTNRGYEVVLINSAEYASSVNDGHYSHNQYNKGGEPYVVKNRTVPFNPTYGNNYPTDKTYVFGRFFVENSIDLTYPKVEQIVMKELEKWWDSV